MYSQPLVPALFLRKGARFDLFYLFFPFLANPNFSFHSTGEHIS